MTDRQQALALQLRTAALRNLDYRRNAMSIGRRVDNPVVAEFYEAAQLNRKPAGYGELLALLDDLPVIVRETRRRKGQSLRAAQADSGVDQATILSAEKGGNLTVANVRLLLAWAGSDGS
jgi:hypothetical protein